MTTTQRNLHKLFIVQGFIMWHMTVKLFRWAKCSDYIYLPHVKSIDAWLPVHKIWHMKQFLQMNPPPWERRDGCNTNLQPNNVGQLTPQKTTTCQVEKWSVQMYRVHISRSGARYIFLMRTSSHSANYNCNLAQYFR